MRGAPPRPREGGAAWGGGDSRRQPHTAKPYAARREGEKFVGKAAFRKVGEGRAS